MGWLFLSISVSAGLIGLGLLVNAIRGEREGRAFATKWAQAMFVGSGVAILVAFGSALAWLGTDPAFAEVSVYVLFSPIPAAYLYFGLKR